MTNPTYKLWPPLLFLLLQPRIPGIYSSRYCDQKRKRTKGDYTKRRYPWIWSRRQDNCHNQGDGHEFADLNCRRRVGVDHGVCYTIPTFISNPECPTWGTIVVSMLLLSRKWYDYVGPVFGADSGGRPNGQAGIGRETEPRTGRWSEVLTGVVVGRRGVRSPTVLYKREPLETTNRPIDGL